MSTPSPQKLQQRKNVVLFVSLAAIVFLVALYPTVCTYVEQPQAYYPTAAEARIRPDGRLPTLIPSSATDIHERHDEDTGRVWTRFHFDPADLDRMTTGMRRVPVDEVPRVPVETPSFTAWWTINPGTLTGSQRRHLRVYEVTGDDAGWLIVDPRSKLAYYWSR